MNSLALLLMATAAAGADPLPVATYTYTEAAPESRPSFFGRIRNALSPRSSANSLSPSDITTGPAARRFGTGGSSAEPPLAESTPVTAPAPKVELRPATPPTVVTQPTYTYPAPVPMPAPESPSRPRLFPRIRKLFGSSSSQPSQALPEDVIVTPIGNR